MFNTTNNELAFGIVLAVLLAVAGIGLLRFTGNHRERMQWQTKLFLIAFAARFAFSIVTYEFGLVKVLGDEDASGWLYGLYLSNLWNRQHLDIFDLPRVLSEAFYEHHKGYFYMLGALFYTTGFPGRMPAAALNCFFGALTVVVSYRVTKSLFSNWASTRVGWTVCLFPSLIVWSAQTVKEPVVIMLEMVALYGVVQLKLKGFTLRHALLSAAAILLLLPFRFYAAYLAGMAALLALAIPAIGKRAKTSFHSGILVAVLVIPIAIYSGILARSQADIEKFDLNAVQKFRTNVAIGQGSGVQTGVDMRSSTGFVAGATIGVAHLLLAPFPWQVNGSLRMLGTLPEVVFWWWLFFTGFLPGLWFAVKNRFNELQPYLFFMGGMALLYGMMFGNVGLIVRERTQLLPMLLAFAYVGLEQREIKKLLKRRGQGQAPVTAPPPRPVRAVS